MNNIEQYYLADFAEEESAPPAWTLITGRTLPGIGLRGAAIGGLYGVKKWNDAQPQRVKQNAYNLVTKNTFKDKAKKIFNKKMLYGAGKGLAIGAGAFGVAKLGMNAYDKYREKNKKGWEL